MNPSRFWLARPLLFLSLAGSATDGAAAAQSAVPDTLLACVSLADDQRRLACFDQELALLTTPATVAKPLEQAPLPQESSIAVATPATEAIDNFGMTPELASKTSASKSDESLKELTAVVVALRKRPRGEQVVTLENGQVWSQTRSESGLLVKEGDTVIIRRGLLGSYRIVGRSKRSFAVERIE